MKLTDNQLPAAETSGDMVTLNMGISDNAEDQLMILNVLSASLYTDKPAAVLREYGCNAFDANVEAGKADVPIEVGLPNKLEPSLRIRDFGLGMTEEQIASTFVMLGRSTKRNSNAFTGMLGIGSKSGFAYGDSFMVTSYTRGNKVVYNAFRDKGAPRLARMLGPVPTQEPDGIEIKVPVRMEHFEEFRQKAERIYRYFKVRPKISGAKVDFLDAERLMSGAGWHYIGNGKSIAIMGNVGYDLNASGMGQLDHKSRTLLDLGVELEFNIGDLEIAANREGLQYKDITKTAVVAKLKQLVKDVGLAFTTQITNAACMWDARKLYAELFERLGNSNTRSLKEVIDGQVTWNGDVINTGRMNMEHTDPEVNIYRVYKHRYSDRRQRETMARYIYASDKTQLVINDLPSKSQSPARERGFFEDPANANFTDWVVFTFQTDAAQKRFWTAAKLTGAPSILMSSITPAVSATAATNVGPRTHNSKHSAKVFVLDESATAVSTYARSSFWKQESVDLDKDSGVYVVIDEFYVRKPPTPGPIVPGDGFEHPDTFRGKVFALRKAGLITGPLYAFKKKLVTDDPPGSNWVLLQDSIEAKLNHEITTKKLSQIAADFVAANRHRPLIKDEHAALFPIGTSVRIMLDKIYELRNPATRPLLNAILNYQSYLPWIKNVNLPPPSVDLDKMKSDVLKEYPLLGLIINIDMMTSSNSSINHVAEFVRLASAAQPKQPKKNK